GVAEIRARLHSFKLEHYLHAPEDLIELILTKLGIGLAEIRPGVNIVSHHLEIVPVDVVVEAAQDRIEPVVTLLSGVYILPLNHGLKLLRNQEIASGYIEAVRHKVGEPWWHSVHGAAVDFFLK